MQNEEERKRSSVVDVEKGCAVRNSAIQDPVSSYWLLPRVMPNIYSPGNPKSADDTFIWV